LFPVPLFVSSQLSLTPSRNSLAPGLYLFQRGLTLTFPEAWSFREGVFSKMG